ncbi:sortase, partial [Candidatus Roizmanbacteria bacterium]|nr:sortase [Candidatus Roizmanbacteria bacterium]
DLPKLKKGDTIHVFTDIDWFVYTVKETFVVDPEKVDVIFSKGHPELTLYTCTGRNYTKRFIIKAELST